MILDNFFSYVILVLFIRAKLRKVNRGLNNPPLANSNIPSPNRPVSYVALNAYPTLGNGKIVRLIVFS